MQRKKLHDIERDYFVDNADCARALADAYYEANDFYMLNYVTRAQRGEAASLLMTAYNLISLYEIGERLVLARKIADNLDSTKEILVSKELPEDVRLRLMSTILGVFNDRKCGNGIVNVKLYRNNYNADRYSVLSFSDTIGLNMTVITTIHGVLIFDCGAMQDSNIKITPMQLDEFFRVNNISKTDIIGVFVSHAHFDHYGSIKNLIAWGVPVEKVFSNRITRELIELTSKAEAINDSPDYRFFRHNSIKVTPFENGHIAGSYGFFVEIFGSGNVLISGDFCYHTQACVAGLDSGRLKQVIGGKDVDCLVVETTYGKKPYEVGFKTNAEIIKRLAKIFDREGVKMIFPAFAIGRSQEILRLLKDAIPNSKIMIDGLSQSVCAYADTNNLAETRFMTRNVNSTENEDKLYNLQMNAAIVASSGMITEGSASFNYILAALDDNELLTTKVIKTGFIAEGCTGERLLAKWAIEKGEVPNLSLSAHASYFEILRLIEEVNPRVVVQVHGDGIVK